MMYTDATRMLRFTWFGAIPGTWDPSEGIG
jgi:hypothetical protein